jgi:hypothetical protein
MMEPADLHAIRSASDAQRPADVVQDGGDLYWYRMIPVIREGERTEVRRRACEDCWRTIPRYVHNPGGFVSPESDVEIPGRKTRMHTMGTRASDGQPLTGVEVIPRAVCRSCFLKAFERVYGQRPPQDVSTDVFADDVVLPPEPESHEQEAAVLMRADMRPGPLLIRATREV